MHFLLFSQGNFQNFLKSFPNNCVFRPNVRKIKTGFVNFFEKQLKLCIYCNFLKKFYCKFSKIFRRPGAPSPGPPTSPTPYNVPSPRTEILAAPLIIYPYSILISVIFDLLYGKSKFSRKSQHVQSIKSVLCKRQQISFCKYLF